jgi:prolipoprotein diacylglyceryltransferase
VLEFFRMDAARGFLLGFSTSQWISALLLIVSLVLLIRPFSRVKAEKY